MLGEDERSVKYVSHQLDPIHWTSAEPSNAVSERNSRNTSPLPTFVNLTDKEPRKATSGSPFTKDNMESCSTPEGSKARNQDHIGLTQIPSFESVDRISKSEEDFIDQNSHIWALAEVEALLKLYKSRETDLKDPRRKKKTIWNEICSEMRLLGYQVSAGQCECKMKNMKATYRRNLEKIRAGDTVQRCAFYEELYEIFGLSPNVRTFPSIPNTEIINSRKRNNNACDINNRDGEEIVLDEDHAATSLGPKRVRSDILGIGFGLQDGLSELELRQSNTEFIEELRMLRKSLEQERLAREEERKKNEEERDRRAREFHEERMAMLNSMNKLIASLGNKD